MPYYTVTQAQPERPNSTGRRLELSIEPFSAAAFLDLPPDRVVRVVDAHDEAEARELGYAWGLGHPRDLSYLGLAPAACIAEIEELRSRTVDKAGKR